MLHVVVRYHVGMSYCYYAGLGKGEDVAVGSCWCISERCDFVSITNWLLPETLIAPRSSRCGGLLRSLLCSLWTFHLLFCKIAVFHHVVLSSKRDSFEKMTSSHIRSVNLLCAHVQWTLLCRCLTVRTGRLAGLLHLRPTVRNLRTTVCRLICIRKDFAVLTDGSKPVPEMWQSKVAAVTRFRSHRSYSTWSVFYCTCLRHSSM